MAPESGPETPRPEPQKGFPKHVPFAEYLNRPEGVRKLTKYEAISIAIGINNMYEEAGNPPAELLQSVPELANQPGAEPKPEIIHSRMTANILSYFITDQSEDVDNIINNALVYVETLDNFLSVKSARYHRLKPDTDPEKAGFQSAISHLKSVHMHLIKPKRDPKSPDINNLLKFAKFVWGKRQQD